MNPVTRISLPEPPALTPVSARDFAAWLSWSFFDGICAYCALQSRALEVDHVEPASYAKERRLDPGNLLPACRACNGPGGKSDYHPDHVERRRLPRDTTGYSALDPRFDDFGLLFDVLEDGRLSVRPGKEHDRALWNVQVLLKLHLPKKVRARQELMELRAVAERLVEHLREEGLDASVETSSPTTRLGENARIILNMLARRLLFYDLFSLKLSEDPKALARNRRHALRTRECGWTPS